MKKNKIPTEKEYEKIVAKRKEKDLQVIELKKALSTMDCHSNQAAAIRDQLGYIEFRFNCPRPYNPITEEFDGFYSYEDYVKVLEDMNK